MKTEQASRVPGLARLTRLAGFLLAIICLTATADLEVLDKIAIIVDEDVIMASEVQSRLAGVKAQLAASNQAQDEEVLREQVIERLIVENLQLQIANRNGVRVSDDELNQALLGIAGQNNLSLEEFQEAITKEGMAWEEMREQVRREILISQVQQGVMRQRITISEQEVNNFLESDLGETLTSDEYRLGHILIANPTNLEIASGDTDIEQSRKKAEQLLEELQADADFASAAQEHSSGQGAERGGDMGWRKAEQLPSLFADIVPEMTVGEVKGPIKSGRGYHLIKLVDMRGADADGQIDQTKVRHILIKPNEIRDELESMELAMSLRTEVSAGRDFEEVAKIHSDDPGSALSGGDLGWNRKGAFVPKFEEVMQRLEEGVLSEVFKTKHGYHFLEVTGRRVEDMSDKYRMGQAENYLRSQKFEEELENWLREIRDQAYVEIKI